MPATAELEGCNTLALPARAPALLRAGSEEAVAGAIDWARGEGLALLPLGEGSNVVLAGNLEQAVLRLETRGREVLAEGEGRVLLRVRAGENWHALVDWTLARGYYGLENLALIPGTVGAAPIQNIGAYGVELERFLVAVHGRELATGEPFTLDAAACRLAYRDSIFKGELSDAVVITAVDLSLSLRADPQLQYPALAKHLEEQGLSSPTPRQVFEAVVAIRSARLPDPAREPNAGSFFKNPVVPTARADELARHFPELPRFPLAGGQCKLPAAWLIDRCGWKGHRVGGVGVHPGHALVLVHYGGSRGRELLALAEEIRASVLARFGVALDIEPRLYGVAV